MAEPRIRAVLTEAWRDLASQRGRGFSLIAACFVAVVVAALAEGMLLGDIVAAEARFVTLGGHTVQAMRTGGEGSNGQLDPGQCAAISEQPWAIAAGGYTDAGPVELGHLPDTRFTLLTTTPDALRVMAPEAAPFADRFAGIVVGPAAAEESGLRPGQRVSVDGRLTRVVAVIDPAAVRTPVLERALVRVGTADQVSVCLVDVRRDVDLDAFATVAAMFADPTTIDTQWYTLRGSFGVPPEDRVATRPTSYLWAVMGAMVAALFVLDTWSRRAEFAVQRASGGSVVAVVVIAVLSRALVLVPTVISGFSVAVATCVILSGRVVPDQVVLMARQAIGVAASTMAILCPAVVLMVRSLSPGTLKDT